MNDSSKLVETVFMSFKSGLHQRVFVYGQKEEDGNSPMKHPPKPTFTPFKGVFDHMGPLNPKKKEPIIEDNEGFDIEV